MNVATAARARFRRDMIVPDLAPRTRPNSSYESSPYSRRTKTSRCFRGSRDTACFRKSWRSFVTDAASGVFGSTAFPALAALSSSRSRRRFFEWSRQVFLAIRNSHSLTR